MHILKIIHGYPPDYNAGSEVYSQSICNELAKYHRVSVFTREENPYANCFDIRYFKEHEKLHFYFVNNPQGKDGYKHYKMDVNFKQLVTEIKPDIAHIGHLNHLSTGLVDVLKGFNIPIIFTLHDFWLMCPRGQFLTRSIGKADNFKVCDGQEHEKCAKNCYEVYFSGKKDERNGDIARWAEWIKNRMKETKAVVNKVDEFIAPSRYLMNRFMNDFNVKKEKIDYLDYGFPTHYLTSTSNRKETDVFTFGYIGTHIPAKGINLLIEAFSRIEERAELRIYGRDNNQSTRALMKMAENSINPISFCGEYINHNLVDQVFSKVDCIVVPSIWSENSPLVIHEAQACKIPVITSDCGGMKEYVKHLENGLLFKHRDVNSLKEQMQFAVQNNLLMKKIGKKGYLYSQDGQVPSIEKHCLNLEKIYKKHLMLKKKNSLWRLTIDTNPEDCNLKCIMCEEHSPYSDFIPDLYKKTGVKRRRMEFSTVKDIFGQADELGVKEIIPSTMGEPLLYKQFDQLFELAAEKNIKINLTTNGTFPKKSVLEWAKLIVPNTSDIKISWNGATEETSKKIMLGVNFHKVIENLKIFIAYRDEYYINTGYFCRVTLQLTFMKNNMHELADIVKLAANLGVDRVKGHQLWDHFDEIKDLSMRASKENITLWNKYVQEAKEAQQNYPKSNGDSVILENIIPLQENEDKEVPESYECPFLEKELWISATGKISPCCAPDNLRKSLGDFGNIHDNSIEEVMQSELYKDLVKNYKSRSLCKQCNMRKPKFS